MHFRIQEINMKNWICKDRRKRRYLQTCVTRNLVMRSGSLLFSLDKIISNMSPWSFSMTTKTLSGVSNIHSRFTMPGWCKFYENKNESHIKHIKEDHSSPALWIKSLTFFYWYRHTHSLSIITLKTLITCKMATSFLSWLSCLVGNLILSITLIATSLPVFLCFP